MRWIAALSACLLSSLIFTAPGASQVTEDHGYRHAVARDGARAVIGADWADGLRGQVLVLERTGDFWRRVQVLAPESRGSFDRFGSAVTIQGDRIVVESRWADDLRGAVTVFERGVKGWVEVERTAGRRLDAPGLLAAASEATAFDDPALVGARDAWQAEIGAAPAVPAVVDPVTSFTATDSLFEDRVNMAWSTVASRNIIYKIYRRLSTDPPASNVLIRVASRNDSTYADTSGIPGVVYTYCITVLDGSNTESAALCDNGARVIFRPGSVQASDGLFEALVRVTWTDRSSIEAAYNVYRNAALIATLGPDVELYRDSSAVAGTVYTYCVSAEDAAGHENASVCDPGSRGYIFPPLDVQATDGQIPDRVRVTWDDQTNREASYRVFRHLSGQPLGAPLATLPPNTETYDDLSAAVGIVYVYCVASVDSSAHESTPVCDLGSRSLAPPEDVSATDGAYDDKVVVTWSDPGPSETGFRVYRRDLLLPDSTLLATTAANATTIEDVDAVPGKTYRYCVVAFSSQGGVSAAGCDLGTRSEIVAATNVAATDGTVEDRVDVTWESASTRVVLFKIYRNGQLITSVSGNERFVSDYDIPSGQSFHYAVAGLTALGVESDSTSDTGFRTLHAPAHVQATDIAFEDRVDVIWEDASEIESGFRIYRRLAGVGTAVEIGSRPAERTSFIDRTGNPGVAYDYFVAAFHDYNDSSSTESARGSDAGQRDLVAPANLMATDGAYENRIDLTWEDESGFEESYVVLRKVVNVGLFSQVAVLSPNATSYSDLTVGFGIRYLYHVQAADSLGGVLLGFSAAAEDTGSTEILPPGSVNASDAYTNRVAVTWVDQSGVETGYIVARDGTPLDTTAANATSFEDTGTTPGAVHDYCVRTLGSGSAVSDPVCDQGVRAAGPGAFTNTAELSVEFEDSSVPSSGRANFGRSLTLDGDWAFVATDHNGNDASPVYLYRRDAGGVFQPDGTILGGAGSDFGFGGSMDIDGELAIIGDYTADTEKGAAFVFKYNSGTETWAQEQKIVLAGVSNFDRSADAVGISGSRAIIGSSDFSTGRVHFYDRSGAVWSPVINFSGTSVFATFGGAVAIDGDHAMASDAYEINPLGTPEGIVYFYVRSGATWTQAARLARSDSSTAAGSPISVFGISVDMDGDYAVVGAQGVNAAYVFKRGATWTEVAKLTPSDGQAGDRFGHSVAIDGNRIIVGAYSDDGNTGAAYLFTREGETWTETTKLVAANRNANEYLSFGEESLAMDDRTALLGAPYRGNGAVFAFEPLGTPGAVEASDGSFADRVQVRWNDLSSNEDGFRVYRNGELIDSTPPNIRVFNDFTADPGGAAEYCISAFSGVYGESPRRCDTGRRAPNGSIAGRVATRAGAGVSEIPVCLDPAPNQGLLFDGIGGSVDLGTLANGDSLTLDLWVNTSAVASPLTYQTLLRRDLPGVSSDLHLFLQGNRVWFINDPGFSNSSSFILTRGQWHHVALTLRQNGSTIQSTYFVDGVKQGPFNGPSGGVLAGSGTWQLGSLNPFSGRLDEVRMWSRIRPDAEIAADAHTPLSGDEQDLLGYWPLDEGMGVLTADLSPNPSYGRLLGGVHWTSQSAPLEACARTDLEGNYVLSGIRYGSSATLRVMPTLDPREFEPAFKTITLTPESPAQNEVEFLDISTFTVSGRIKYKDYDCYAQNVEILVDGVTRGTTDSKGRYAVPVELGTHVLEPHLEGHTFQPGPVTLQISRDRAGLDFLDTTTRSLAGHVGGGCDLAIGTLALVIESEDGCLSVADTTAGDYELRLPPLKYFVRVDDVDENTIPAALDPGDVVRFFDNLGTQEADLSTADATVDFIYRAPLTVRIVGFPTPTCPAPFDDAPVIEQGNPIPLTIEVFEDYGVEGMCPLDSGTVTIFDEIIDEVDTPTTLTVRNGQAAYTTIGNTPFVFEGRRDRNGKDRSYQKNITFVVKAKGLAPVTVIQWAVVTGHRPRVASFTSISEELPVLILRDPPGDHSTSFVEEGETFCTDISNIFLENLATGLNVKAKVGLRFSKGTPFFSTDSEVGNETENKFRIGVEATQTDGLRICATTTERFITSDSDLFIGDNADLFLGVALNVVFAKTDVIDVENCQVVKSEAITFGGDSVDPYKTTYLFTTTHIRDTLIPQLEDLANNPSVSPDSAAFFASAADNWNEHLDYNRTLKKDATFQENRSFSAGANYEFSATDDTTNTFNWNTKLFTNNELSLGFIFDESGSGTAFQFVVGLGFEWTHDVTMDTTRTRTVGYTLADDDLGDFFSVDIKDDPFYDTPVFDAIGGVSSCPWEPWPNTQGEPRMQAAEGSLITIEPQEQNSVPPEEPAAFTLSLTNVGEAEQLREYALYPVHTSNPGGAILKVNGIPLMSGISFFIDPFQTHEVTLTVERGPNKFFYENLQVFMGTPCEYENYRNGAPLQRADTVSFNVSFQAPCSDITLLRPLPGWASGAGDDTVEIILSDYELEISEVDSLDQIGVEYRLQDTETWNPIRIITRNNIPLDAQGDPRSVVIDWYVGSIPQGVYEVRAFTKCPLGKAFSGIATGRLDRDPPAVFGAPHPADEILSLGENIAVTFNEDIDCERVGPDDLTLRRANDDPIGIDVVCNGRTIILDPTTPIANFEDEVLTARVTGIRDLAGNVMNGSREWSFEVQQSKFTWVASAAATTVPFRNPGSFSAEVVNGLAQKVRLGFSGVASFLTPVAPDSIQSGETVPVQFLIQESIAIGSYRDTLLAVAGPAGSPLAVSQLIVNLDVTCQAPVWNLDPADFEHTMTVVAKLSIAGAESNDINDQVAAFVGGELRGVAHVERVSPLGASVYMAFLQVHSNRTSGETVRFRVWDASACRLYTGTDKAYSFTVDGRQGSPETPVTLIAQDVPVGAVQNIPLAAGWSWFSVNLTSLTDMSLSTVLGDLNPAEGDIIKSQTAFSQFDLGTGWVGTLSTISPLSAYMIDLSAAGSIVHEGTAVDPATTAIPVVTGWNWIGYTPQVQIATGSALAALLTPWLENGTPRALVKGRDSFAEYTKKLVGSQYVTGWFGGLKSMLPGHGFKLYLPYTSPPSNFKYPASGPAALFLELTGREQLEQPILQGGPEAPRNPEHVGEGAGTPDPAGSASDYGTPLAWEVDPFAYSSSMTITARLFAEDGATVIGPDDMVAAFVGGEVRGVTRPLILYGYEEPRVFLLVHGDPRQQEIRFAVWKTSENRLLEGRDALTFEPDGAVGTVREPWTIRMSPVVSPSSLPLTFAMTPMFANPLRAGAPATINYALPVAAHVALRLFDVQGREVLRLVDGVKEAGWHSASFEPSSLASGIYYTRIQAGSFVHSDKIVLVK